MLGDGCSVRLWKDVWVDDKPLKDEYHGLYLLCFDHNIIVAETLQKGWGGFIFRRTLYGDSLEPWKNHKLRCEEIEMRSGKVQVEWSLTRDKKFSVKILYRKLIALDCNFPQKFP